MGFFSSTEKQPKSEPVKFKYFKAPVNTVKVEKPKAVKKVVKKVAKKKPAKKSK